MVWPGEHGCKAGNWEQSRHLDPDPQTPQLAFAYDLIRIILEPRSLNPDSECLVTEKMNS